MKKILAITTITLLFIFSSCGNKGSYYEQFSNNKLFSARISDLNKTIAEVRKFEKGKLEEEGVTFLKYEYKIGENNTYMVSYLFDEKGCYEIGIDGFFELEADAKNVVEGIKTEMNQSEYGIGTEDNHLTRWLNADQSISVELDDKDTSRGMFVATIFANE